MFLEQNLIYFKHLTFKSLDFFFFNLQIQMQPNVNTFFLSFCFRVALQFVHEMQHKSLKNFDASRDRSLPVFGVGVAFIDETSISPLPSHDIDRAIQDIRSIVSNLAPPIKQLHVVPIENIYSGDRTDRLKNLLDAVSDTTGKEDLLLHIRMLSLQKVQSRHFQY
jgi:cytoplasmic tRNA 2-thiolation protein 2